MHIQGMIIIDDSVLVQSFGWVTVPLKANLPIMLFSCANANCIPVACEAIPVERHTGNLLLSGTVHINAQFIIIILGLEV